MGEVLLAGGCMLLYGLINFLGGIFVRRVFLNEKE